MLLLGLCTKTKERMTEAVKEFWEKMWRVRCRENECTGYFIPVLFLLVFCFCLLQELPI